MKPIALAFVIALLTKALVAGEIHQPYAGMDARKIASLSANDIAELERGGGWGLALPAELNGYPGPAHVLEFRAKLDLSADQVAQFEAIFATMQAEAIAIGQRLIQAELALDDAFKNGGLEKAQLQKLIETAERHRAELRLVHLSRHLMSVNILSPEQIAHYNTLRGYTQADADPCATIPDGHDPQMWRKHNGCPDN